MNSAILTTTQAFSQHSGLTAGREGQQVKGILYIYQQRYFIFNFSYRVDFFSPSINKLLRFQSLYYYPKLHTQMRVLPYCPGRRRESIKDTMCSVTYENIRKKNNKHRMLQFTKKWFTFPFNCARKKVQVESNKSIMQIIRITQNSFSITLLCSGLHRRVVAILSIAAVIFHYIHYKVWRLSKWHLSYIMIWHRLDKMFIKTVEE